MSTHKKIINFEGTLRLARILFKDSSCSLEQRIIRILNSMTERGSDADSYLHIKAKRRQIFWGTPNECVHTLSVDQLGEKAIQNGISIKYKQVVSQKLYREKFYKIVV